MRTADSPLLREVRRLEIDYTKDRSSPGEGLFLLRTRYENHLLASLACSANRKTKLI